jgi:hypothetical protein
LISSSQFEGDGKMPKKIYFYYIVIAVLYPVVKVICYINDLVYLRGVIYGLIAGVSTITIGILALKEYDGADKPVWHWLAALVPLIVIPLTPIIMIVHLGLRMFLMEKMTPFMIFEGIAVAQFIVAILMFLGLIFKRGTDKQKMPRIGFTIMKTVLTLRSLFKKKRIANVKTILSARETGLPDESVDIVLLYDVFQMVSDKEKLLEELHRVLKSGGFLFATAEHLDLKEFMNMFARGNLFTLIEQSLGEVLRFKRD